MIGYKVVSDDLTSALERASKVQYLVGKRVDRPTGCGPLAVFSTLTYAKHFAGNHLRLLEGCRMLRVFKCRYSLSIDSYLWSQPPVLSRYFPRGTVLADWVELLEEVT